MSVLVLFVQTCAGRALPWDDPTKKELYHMPRNGLYEGQSVNRTQMDIKRKTRDIQTWEKHFSTYPTPTLIHTPIALPVHRNPQHRNLLTVVSATSAASF
jgi:hypothetical protein